MIRHRNRRKRHGVIVVLFAVCLPVMLIITAFSINLAYMELTRTELQIATDAATRAAGRELVLAASEADAIAEGIDAASRNFVGGVPLALTAADFEFGVSRRNSLAGKYDFVPSTGQVNAVRVHGERSAVSSSGTVPLFFSSLTNVSDFAPEQQGVATQIELDLAIVIDRSGSMAYSASESSSSGTPSSAPEDWAFGDAAPPDSRWRDTVTAVQAFLAEMGSTPQDENITVLTYNGSTGVDVDFTSNYSDFYTALDGYTDSFTGGSTNITAAINGAADAIANSGNARPWAAKVIIVLTDGKDTSDTDPATAATSAAGQGVTVYTVTFSDEADQTKMGEVATNGAGKHFHADSPEALVDAFREIARNLPTLLTK